MELLLALAIQFGWIEPATMPVLGPSVSESMERHANEEAIRLLRQEYLRERQEIYDYCKSEWMRRSKDKPCAAKPWHTWIKHLKIAYEGKCHREWDELDQKYAPRFAEFGCDVPSQE